MAPAEPSFPFFTRIYRLLVATAVASPIIAALPAWLLGDQMGLPVWLVGVIVGGGLATVATAIIWLVAQRFRESLRETVDWVRAASRGALDSRLTVHDDDEAAILKRAINELSAHLILAQEVNVDRRFLQNVIDAIPEPLVVLDANGVVALSNKRFSEMLKFDGSFGPIGRGLETLAGVQMPLWYRQLLDGSSGPFEIDFQTRDGQPISLLVSGALLHDSADQLSGVVLLVRDSSEVDELNQRLQEATAKAAESAAVFQDLFDAIEDPITVLGLNGDVLQANRAARSMFGRNVVGKKCYRAFRMRDSMCDDCPASQTYANKRSVAVEHRVFGNAITRINTYPLLGKNGEVRAILNHKRDVTNERQLEDLKASFLAAVSHELRTPLTSIIGFNKLNKRRLLRHLGPHLEGAPHKARIAFQQILDDMDVMVSEGERLGRLVNDILDLSKLEAGRMHLQMAEADLAPVVNGAVASTAALWRAKGLLLETNIPDDLPMVWADSDRLAQVMVNLLSNSTKFTESGTIQVDVSFDGGYVTVAVTDTGRGIPPDEVNGVFEKFRQVEETTVGRPLGTGLGLPICRELVHLHHGRIWVESVMGEGTTFFFTVLRADNRAQYLPRVKDRTSFSKEA
jgi:signal transduction histidine kinase